MSWGVCVANKCQCHMKAEGVLKEQVGRCHGGGMAQVGEGGGVEAGGEGGQKQTLLEEGVGILVVKG